jgi:hypothetical protein
MIKGDFFIDSDFFYNEMCEFSTLAGCLVNFFIAYDFFVVSQIIREIFYTGFFLN